MTDLWAQHRRAVEAWKGAHPQKRLLPGIFSDVYGTLVDFNGRCGHLRAYVETLDNAGNMGAERRAGAPPAPGL